MEFVERKMRDVPVGELIADIMLTLGERDHSVTQSNEDAGDREDSSDTEESVEGVCHLTRPPVVCAADSESPAGIVALPELAEAVVSPSCSLNNAAVLVDASDENPCAVTGCSGDWLPHLFSPAAGGDQEEDQREDAEPDVVSRNGEPSEHAGSDEKADPPRSHDHLFAVSNGEDGVSFSTNKQDTPRDGEPGSHPGAVVTPRLPCSRSVPTPRREIHSDWYGTNLKTGKNRFPNVRKSWKRTGYDLMPLSRRSHWL
jgi:hypothetical protein